MKRTIKKIAPFFLIVLFAGMLSGCETEDPRSIDQFAGTWINSEEGYKIVANDLVFILYKTIQDGDDTWEKAVYRGTYEHSETEIKLRILEGNVRDKKDNPYNEWLGYERLPSNLKYGSSINGGTIKGKTFNSGWWGTFTR